MSYPDPLLGLHGQSETMTVAMTIWGEARGESHDGKQAVACVIQNRVLSGNHKRWGEGWKGVCLHPWQFSCWNPRDINSTMLLYPGRHGSQKEWDDCFQLARTAVAKGLPDITGCADHYYSRYIPLPRNWERMVLTARIGMHDFFESLGA